MPAWEEARPLEAGTLQSGLRSRSNPERVPAFIAACVADIAERQGIEIAAVLPDEHVAERRPVTLRGRVEQLYEAVERLVYRGGRRALRLTDLPAEVAQTPRSLLDVRHSGSIDVLVDLRRQHRGLPIAEPRYGRWHLEFAAGEGAPRRARLDRPGPDTHLVEAVLVGERGTDRRCDLEHSIGSIDRIAFARTRDATYWKAAAFPGRRLEALRSHGPQALRGLVGPRTGATRKQGGPPAVEAPLSPDADGGRRPPGPPIGAFLRAAAVRLMERLVYADGWVVLSRPREPGTGPPADVSGFREIPAPSGRFFADPFVVADATATHLFVEDCPNGRHQGELSRLTLGVDGTWSNPTVILKRDHHLSYPHVVRIGNDTFLTPDGGGRIDLYRSVGWPDHWEHTSTNSRRCRGLGPDPPRARWPLLAVRDQGGPRRASRGRALPLQRARPARSVGGASRQPRGLRRATGSTGRPCLRGWWSPHPPGSGLLDELRAQGRPE